MKSILFLDDSEGRHSTATKRFKNLDLWHVWDAERCIKLLQEQKFDVISLDRDLGKDSASGEVVTDWMCSQNINHFGDPIVIIHSWNIDAAKRMEDQLRAKGFCVYRQLFEA